MNLNFVKFYRIYLSLRSLKTRFFLVLETLKMISCNLPLCELKTLSNHDVILQNNSSIYASNHPSILQLFTYTFACSCSTNIGFQIEAAIIIIIIFLAQTYVFQSAEEKFKMLLQYRFFPSLGLVQ